MTRTRSASFRPEMLNERLLFTETRSLLVTGIDSSRVDVPSVSSLHKMESKYSRPAGMVIFLLRSFPVLESLRRMVVGTSRSSDELIVNGI